MIIANPIYGIIFKYLLEDLDIARELLSLIIEEEIISLEVKLLNTRILWFLKLNYTPNDSTQYVCPAKHIALPSDTGDILQLLESSHKDRPFYQILKSSTLFIQDCQLRAVAFIPDPEGIGVFRSIR